MANKTDDGCPPDKTRLNNTIQVRYGCAFVPQRPDCGPVSAMAPRVNLDVKPAGLWRILVVTLCNAVLTGKEERKALAQQLLDLLGEVTE